jgi:ribosomal protein S18 acetylase RimI-like enzyme
VTVSAAPKIRRRVRPGDPEGIVAMHGRIYPREYAVDAEFEAHVAASVTRAVKRGWPGAREGIWIVELGGEMAGSLALTDDGNDEAALRWFVLERRLRGRGLGRRLVEELIARAEAEGYARIGLETFSELETAARIYRDAGFELVWEETGPRWGRTELAYQRYELSLRSSASPRREARAAPAPASGPSR